ncbi:hypothetical protein C7999DRAFT_31050 [Corynascus novoguineensis]|uniref:Uncharacterized protein n=1 Tax=Corynascus novoguineensis TaxID=1126955 RepID=A0AAN7CWJ6_9PEZI|nr:hypothetical protein C7999DRAFT_31050 [Corynascus novoguineensis]
MAEMRDPAGGGDGLSPGHSTLEVVSGHNHDRAAAFGKNDKVAYTPARENDKVVVDQQLPDAQKPLTPGAYGDQHQHGPYSPQTTYTQGGWDDSTVRGPSMAGADENKKILGMKRRTFFILLWVVSILAAIGVGVGVGVGVSRRSSDSDDETGTGEVASGSDVSGGPPRTTGTTGTSLPSSAVTSTHSRGSDSDRPTPTVSSVTISAPRSTGAVQLGGVGGRCSNNWGLDCICLERDVCINRWTGEPMTGTGPNDWPCPDDPPDIVACIIRPCLGMSTSSPSQYHMSEKAIRDFGSTAGSIWW